MSSSQESPRDSALRAAHRYSARHRFEIEASSRCGCFHCRTTFPPSAIQDWTDTQRGRGETALCPICGIDSVIGDSSGYPLTAEFLTGMHDYWF
ncbi:cytoplasmic protein [Nocardia rhizosphaerae]|uniref:Cytoplasmic protein n=1 Tax=Nocardia rhizosphaerae TaxID=1691571 RepID=A0ABV8LDC4_9NOCA